MNLWIRSQSRSMLIKATDVYLDYDTMIKCEGHFMGEYATTKRALEVIDEIQELLNTRICFENYNSFNLIYEMPKE